MIGNVGARAEPVAVAEAARRDWEVRRLVRNLHDPVRGPVRGAPFDGG